jgi:Arylsulfotransferase (ASST)
MRRLKTCQAGFPAAIKELITISGLLLLSACGSHSSSSQSVASGQTSVTAQPAVSQPNSFQIQVSPALTPSFDPSIHDYVINCTSNPEVQFTAALGGVNFFSFLAPGERGGREPSFPIGYFQKTLTMNPGQRFRFIVGPASSEYSVRCLPQDFPPLTVSMAGNSEAEWFLFAPTLFFSLPTNTKPSAYVIMTDANGTPVWWKKEPGGSALDAKVLGPNEITWTLQSNEPDGQYVIRNFSGEIINVIGSDLNDHDLQPTPNGTFLAIRDVARICPPDCADMSPWGGSGQTAALDQEIVELDQNSNILWIWRTRDHIALSETGAAGWFPGVGNDIIHMNAVEPDGTDAVFFSARHLNAIYHITKSTGAIDWKIGGTNRAESLVVVGDTRPTAIGANGHPLSGQHDVRLWADGTVSVHDNGTIANRPPSIVRYQIDTASRTALVVEQLQDALDPVSICCGSARRLPAGHWLVQWGGLPYMTELDGKGNTVISIHYNLGSQFSYRAIPVLPGAVSAAVLRAGMDALSGELIQ